MTFLLFFILGQLSFEVHAADDSELAIKNPTISFNYLDYVALNHKSAEFNIVQMKEKREEVIPSLSENPTCRSIRDSIINLCSRKTDSQSSNSQAYKIDPQEKSQRLLEIKKMIKDSIAETLSTSHLDSLSLECKNKIDVFRKTVDSKEFDDFVLSSKFKPRYESVFKLFLNPNSNSKCDISFITGLHDKLIELNTLQKSINNILIVDMWRFGKDSPCESVRVDYNSEDSLEGISLVKKETKDEKAITYNVQIKDHDDSFNSSKEQSKKDSSFCNPNLKMKQNGKPLYSSDKIQTEFDKELSVILSRTSAEKMFTPPDNRRGPTNPDSGNGKQ